MRAQLAERLIAKKGASATLRTYSSGGEDEYGDPTFTTTETTLTVLKSFAGRLGSTFPDKIDSETGEYRTVQYNFFTTDTIDVSIDATSKLPVLVYDGILYTVIDTEDVSIGVTRLLCEQQRT